MSVLKLFVLVVSVAFVSACASPKSFVDPTYPKLTYDEIQKQPAPLKLSLSTQFQRNGEPFPRADPTLKDNTERVLRASGVVTPTTDGAEGQIRIVVNNIADTGAAAAKGFGTGLTFGLVGTTVADAYEMSVTITVGTKTFSRTAVKHAFHTAIGNTSTPAGVETVAPNVAFERVLEQMILRVLKEYQTSPEFSLVHDATAA
jgi:hypothetical protein